MIGLAKSHDAVQIAKLHVQSWLESYEGMVRPEILLSLDVSQKQQLWAELCESPVHKIFVYEQDGEIQGFLDGYLPDTLPVAQVMAFYLLKRVQRKGVGMQLFHHFLREIRPERYHALQLEVFDLNSARYFYEKLGGEIIAEQDASDYGENLKTLHYQWRLG
ncbi:GNAT family N-acetyltransferase [Acinetobacter sp. WZC-1]|uniref:GNAT family N-acetyltransferase n=1 Tax=Acinetobacter sp. WZC-1 TaxID=3459034 RepID=UPI00403D7FDE